MLVRSTFFNQKNILPVEEEKQPTFSRAIVEINLLTFVLVLGLNTVVVLIAQAIRIPFSVYLMICPMVSLLGVGWACYLGFPKIKSVVIRDYGVLAKLFILGLLCSAIAVLSPKGINNNDNTLYVPNAVYFLDHPNQLMDFEIHFFIGQDNQPIVSPNQATSLAYEYFRAVIAHYLKLEYLTSYFYTGGITALFLPFAIFLLINCFVNDTQRVLFGTVISIGLILIATDGERTYGTLNFVYAHMGKFVFLLIGVPLFAAYSIAFFQKPSRVGWLSLLFCTTAMVGMTTSATVLLGTLAMILLITCVLTSWINARSNVDWKNMLIQSGLYLSSLTFIFMYVVFLFLMLKSGITTGNYDVLNGSSDFMEQVKQLFYLNYPLTPFLMLLSPVLVFVLIKGWQRQFLLLWMFVIVILFLNPIGTRLFIDTVIPSNIYWRVFFLFPFPLALGIAATRLPLSPKVSPIFEMSVILLALMSYTTQPSYTQKSDLLLSHPLQTIPNLGVARKVIEIAPPGAMLSPPDLFGVIPMIDGFHPQVSTRNDANNLWLTKNRENRVRIHASRFIAGEPEFIGDFARLIQANIIQTIVFHEKIFNDPIVQRVNFLLKKYGFNHKQTVGDYIVVWK